MTSLICEVYNKVKLKEQNSSRLTDSEKGLVVTKGEEMGWVVGREEKGIKGHYN